MRISGKNSGVNVDIRCRIEIGKVLLEWETDWEGRAEFSLKDARGNIVLESYKMWAEDEPVQAVLLKPVLWTGMETPYLYTLEILFMDRQGNVVDTVTESFPLRSITRQMNPVTEEENFRLNGEKIVWKTVRYRVKDERLSEVMSGGQQASFVLQQQMMEDMRLLADLGANSICLEGEECPLSLLRLCDRLGVLVVVVRETCIWISGDTFASEQRCGRDCDNEVLLREILGDVPLLCGGQNALLTPEHKSTESYYRYKAHWSTEPFVHLCHESLKRHENGNYKVTCYSNCKKVALYVEGKFFELQQGQEAFVFEEIPVKGPCIVLSAEGEGCSMSLSFHRNFTKLSRIGDI